jgi:hypothetical protein
MLKRCALIFGSLHRCRSHWKAQGVRPSARRAVGRHGDGAPMVEGESFIVRESFARRSGGNEFLMRGLPCSATKGALHDRMTSDSSPSALGGPNETADIGQKRVVALRAIIFLRAVRPRGSSVSTGTARFSKAPTAACRRRAPQGSDGRRSEIMLVEWMVDSHTASRRRDIGPSPKHRRRGTTPPTPRFTRRLEPLELPPWRMRPRATDARNRRRSRATAGVRHQATERSRGTISLT